MNYQLENNVELKALSLLYLLESRQKDHFMQMTLMFGNFLTFLEKSKQDSMSESKI